MIFTRHQHEVGAVDHVYTTTADNSHNRLGSYPTMDERILSPTTAYLETHHVRHHIPAEHTETGERTRNDDLPMSPRL